MYRINELIKVDRKIFHTRDLAILWNVENKNTLYTAIKRYVKKGILIPIYKGLYATIPLDQLDPYELGRAIIHRYAYVSTESVLVEAGVISQISTAHTFVTDQSKKVTLGDVSFLYRQLKLEYLFHPEGIIQKNGVFFATPERAAADLLYFNPKAYLDVPEAINMKTVKAIQEEVGYL